MMVLSRWTTAASSSVEADGGGFLSRRADVAVEDRGDTTRGGACEEKMARHLGSCEEECRGNEKKATKCWRQPRQGGVFSPFLVRSAGDLGGIKTGTYLGKLLAKFILINFVNFDLRTFLRELLEML
jgi:hypothetical protein